jgi:hypothetical protein
MRHAVCQIGTPYYFVLLKPLLLEIAYTFEESGIH